MRCACSFREAPCLPENIDRSQSWLQTTYRQPSVKKLAHSPLMLPKTAESSRFDDCGYLMYLGKGYTMKSLRAPFYYSLSFLTSPTKPYYHDDETLLQTSIGDLLMVLPHLPLLLLSHPLVPYIEELLSHRHLTSTTITITLRTITRHQRITYPYPPASATKLKSLKEYIFTSYAFIKSIHQSQTRTI